MNKQNIVRISILAGVAILVAGVVGVKMYSKAQVSAATKVETAAPAEDATAPVGESAPPEVPAEAEPAKASAEQDKPVTVKVSKTAKAFPDEPLALTKELDLATIRSYGVPVVIDFGADSCIPCKQMAPVLVALHDELKGKAIVRFVDVWKYRELAEGIPLQVIPTQVFFDADGKPFTPPESLGIPVNMYSNKNTNEHVFTTHEGGLTKEQLLAIIDAMGAKK